MNRAISGTDEDRPVLWDAIEALKRGYSLIVYKFDRLARNAFLAYTIERQCNKKGAKIVSAGGEGTIEQSMTPEERLKIGMLRLFAEYERNIIAARTKVAMLRHQANGRRMSNLTPFGWERNPENSDLLVKDPFEQNIISHISNIRDTGESYRGICRKLESEGVPCRKNNRWHHTTVKNILIRRNNEETRCALNIT